MLFNPCPNLNRGSNSLNSASDLNMVSEFNEIELRLKSAKKLFQSNAGLNLEKFNTTLSGNNHILAAASI